MQGETVVVQIIVAEQQSGIYFLNDFVVIYYWLYTFEKASTNFLDGSKTVQYNTNKWKEMPCLNIVSFIVILVSSAMYFCSSWEIQIADHI